MNDCSRVRFKSRIPGNQIASAMGLAMNQIMGWDVHFIGKGKFIYRYHLGTVVSLDPRAWTWSIQ